MVGQVSHLAGHDWADPSDFTRAPYVLVFLGAKSDTREFPNNNVPWPNSLSAIQLATTTPATPLNDAHPGGFLFWAARKFSWQGGTDAF